MKTVWPGMDQMISDYNTLERNLRELRTILTCIALQQDDKKLEVPFSAIAEIPAGTELEVSIDRVHENYTFSVILPEGYVPPVAESASLAANDEVAGGLG